MCNMRVSARGKSTATKATCDSNRADTKSHVAGESIEFRNAQGRLGAPSVRKGLCSWGRFDSERTLPVSTSV